MKFVSAVRGSQRCAHPLREKFALLSTDLPLSQEGLIRILSPATCRHHSFEYQHENYEGECWPWPVEDTYFAAVVGTRVLSNAIFSRRMHSFLWPPSLVSHKLLERNRPSEYRHEIKGEA